MKNKVTCRKADSCIKVGLHTACTYSDGSRCGFFADNPNVLPGKLPDLLIYRLDFTHVEGNPQVQSQGVQFCIKTENKGYFSPALERYLTRQDLAKIERIFL